LLDFSALALGAGGVSVLVLAHRLRTLEVVAAGKTVVEVGGHQSSSWLLRGTGDSVGPERAVSKLRGRSDGCPAGGGAGWEAMKEADGLVRARLTTRHRLQAEARSRERVRRRLIVHSSRKPVSPGLRVDLSSGGEETCFEFLDGGPSRSDSALSTPEALESASERDDGRWSLALENRWPRRVRFMR